MQGSRSVPSNSPPPSKNLDSSYGPHTGFHCDNHYIRIHDRILLQLWSIHSSFFGRKIFYTCTFEQERRVGLLWSGRGFGDLQPVVRSESDVSFLDDSCIRHICNFCCRSSPWQSIHNRAWGSRFWSTCSLGALLPSRTLPWSYCRARRRNNGSGCLPLPKVPQTNLCGVGRGTPSLSYAVMASPFSLTFPFV